MIIAPTAGIATLLIGGHKNLKATAGLLICIHHQKTLCLVFEKNS